MASDFTPRLHPVVDPINAIVMHVTVADIDTVMVGGDVVKKNGRLLPTISAKAIAGLDESGTWVDGVVRAGAGWTPEKPQWMGTEREHHVSNAGQPVAEES